MGLITHRETYGSVHCYDFSCFHDLATHNASVNTFLGQRSGNADGLVGHSKEIFGHSPLNSRNSLLALSYLNSWAPRPLQTSAAFFLLRASDAWNSSEKTEVVRLKAYTWDARVERLGFTRTSSALVLVKAPAGNRHVTFTGKWQVEEPADKLEPNEEMF